MEFKIRCSSISEIIAGTYGLTEAQQRTLNELESKEKLTEKQTETLNDLRIKSTQNEISEGAKTYCKRWLKQKLYGRYMPLDNKYINKGLEVEEEAFTLLAVVLGLGMVFKNEERRSNDYMSGECDLYLPKYQGKKTIIDNKASWSLETFPMFDDKPDQKYYWQGQGYMELWDAEQFLLCYTLIDCPIHILEKELKWIENENDRQQKASNLIFTTKSWIEAKEKFFPNADEYRFIEIPKEKRVKTFVIDRNNNDICRIRDKAKLCSEYINTLIK